MTKQESQFPATLRYNRKTCCVLYTRLSFHVYSIAVEPSRALSFFKFVYRPRSKLNLSHRYVTRLRNYYGEISLQRATPDLEIEFVIPKVRYIRPRIRRRFNHTWLLRKCRSIHYNRMISISCIFPLFDNVHGKLRDAIYFKSESTSR